ncbi:MAG: hypothetical protein QOJ90_2117 [Actinomycetota bacterium]|nr:hypothetical protein [Actinomycetota bacterium]MDQ1642766.1 hypothetical protein [Actinomycetota bacterium]
MSTHQVDRVSGARLVGGEMLLWSDLARGSSSGAATYLLREAVRNGCSAGRVLVLGPRATDVIQGLPGEAKIDVLLRGLPDARQLSTLSQLRPGVTIYCGALDRFEPEHNYDLVVSLDGPETLLSPDSDGLSHQEVLRRLSKWLSPEGTLFATVANDLGFDRLFRLEVRDLYDADDKWYRGAPGFDDRPLYYSELRDALVAADLEAESVYAAFPAAESLSMLVARDAVNDPAVRASAAALAAQEEMEHFADQPSLLDPYDLALRIFQSGLAVELAPAWLVIARHSSAAAAAEADDAQPELPALIATGDSGRPEWRVLTTIERRDGEWAREVHPTSVATEMRERNVVRDFNRIDPAPPPGDFTLEALLRRACASGDIARIRHLVQRYADWLLDEKGWVGDDSASRFFAVPSNVIVGEDSLVCFDRTWQFTAPMTGEVLLVRGLRDFARRLLRSGGEHPWAAVISPDELTQTLLSMTGIAWSGQYADQVARAEAELEVVIGGGDAVNESMAYSLNLERGRSQLVATAGPSRGYREALAASWRMAQALNERDAQVEWLEATLRARDRRVGTLEKQVSSITGSMSFRIGRFFTWPVRALVQGARRVALSAIPAGYITRAKLLVRRLAHRLEEES